MDTGPPAAADASTDATGGPDGVSGSVGGFGKDADRDRIVTRDVALLSDAWSRLESVRFDYRRRDGNWECQTREIYHRGHGATVLLHDIARRMVVLVRQFRYPAHAATGRGFLVEAPAGMLDDNDPASTIIAETEQETGYRIGIPEYLFAAYVSPGSVTERIHFFAAACEPGERIGKGGGLSEEGEDIEVLETGIDEALAMIRDGRIEDMKTILLLQHAALHVFPRRGA